MLRLELLPGPAAAVTVIGVGPAEEKFTLLPQVLGDPLQRLLGELLQEDARAVGADRVQNILLGRRLLFCDSWAPSTLLSIWTSGARLVFNLSYVISIDLNISRKSRK